MSAITPLSFAYITVTKVSELLEPKHRTNTRMNQIIKCLGKFEDTMVL